jgi:hypothetical protein
MTEQAALAEHAAARRSVRSLLVTPELPLEELIGGGLINLNMAILLQLLLNLHAT